MSLSDETAVESRLIATLREYKNPLVVFCIGILVGSTFYFQNIELKILIALCIAISALGVFSKSKKNFLLVLAIFFSYFYVLGYLKLSAIDLDPFVDQRNIYVGEISSKPTSYNYYKKYELSLKNIQSQNGKRWKLSDCKVEVIGAKYEEYEIGDIVQVTGKLKHPKNAILPGLFDEKKYLITKNINYILQAEKGSLVYLEESTKYKFIKLINRLRQELFEINKKFLNSDRLAIVNGITFGSKASALNKELNEKIQALGLSHITSASGFNVSILAFGIFFVFNLFKYKKRILPTVISIFIVLLYSAIAEFSPSIIRATIFILILLIGNLFDKKVKIIPGVCVIIVGFFIFNPTNLLDMGLQLSILGFLGLELFASEVTNRSKNWLLNTLYQTLFAQIMVLPLIAFYFHNIQILGLISNIVAIPLASLILILGMLNIIFFQIPGINLILQAILFHSSGLFVLWVNYLNKFPFKQIYLPALNFPVLILIYFIVMFLLSMLFIKLSKTKILFFTLIIIPAFLITYYLTDTSNYFKIFFLQTYNQDSILIMPPKERPIYLSTNSANFNNHNIQEFIMLNNNFSSTIYYNIKNNIQAPFPSNYVTNEKNKINVTYKNFSVDIIKNYNDKVNPHVQYLKLPILNKKDFPLSEMLVSLPGTIIVNDFKKLSKKSKNDILWLKSRPCTTLFLTETGTIALVSDGKKTQLATSNY